MTTTLLLADDSPEVLQFAASQLSGQDYRILTAPNGLKLCEIAEHELPSVILSDWDMPKRSGLEALRYLKSQASTKDIPVLIMTGVHTASSDLSEALEAGALDFLRKPLDKLELKARVRNALRLVEIRKEIEQAHVRELAAKNAELERLTRATLERNRILVQLRKQLDQILDIQFSSGSQSSESTNLQKARVDAVFQDKLQDESDWATFRVRFEEAFPGYFERLHEAFPKLTANDERLCAYIRMGLSNKEIAELMGVSLRSTEQARYRLRKKLELENRGSLWRTLSTL